MNFVGRSNVDLSAVDHFALSVSCKSSCRESAITDRMDLVTVGLHNVGLAGLYRRESARRGFFVSGLRECCLVRSS